MNRKPPNQIPLIRMLRETCLLSILIPFLVSSCNRDFEISTGNLSPEINYHDFFPLKIEKKLFSYYYESVGYRREKRIRGMALWDFFKIDRENDTTICLVRETRIDSVDDVIQGFHWSFIDTVDRQFEIREDPDHNIYMPAFTQNHFPRYDQSDDYIFKMIDFNSECIHILLKKNVGLYKLTYSACGLANPNYWHYQLIENE